MTPTIKDIIPANVNLKWLHTNTIYLTKYGSHAYGTSTPESDLDIRGIAIPPKEYYFGVLSTFEQYLSSEPYDLCIFDLRKFVKLAMDANPNALEIIFTDPSDILFINNIGFKLLDIRDYFLSKKARFTFGGYALQQLKRIKRHRRWILYPLKSKPLRADFGLPDNSKLIPNAQLLEIESEISKKINEWNIDTNGMENDKIIKFKNELHDVLFDLKINHENMYIYAARSLGLNDELLESFKKEHAYKNALKEWHDFETWKLERNRSRYELEEKFHYDVKHGMHLVRLTRQCVELLRDGKLNVKRDDCDELLSIRNGLWSFDQLIEYSDNQNNILDELYKSSSLRKEPERIKINDWIINTLSESLDI